MSLTWKKDTLSECYNILTATGAWEDIELPDGVVGKAVLVQVHSSDDTIFDPDSSCLPFLYSHDETDGWVVVSSTGLIVNLRDSGRSSVSGAIGRIRTTADAIVSIMIIN